MKFIDKEDRYKIEIVNKSLRTNYRTRPYDFKNPDDIVEATIMATAEYVDFTYYCDILEELHEAFDQTLEVFYPSEWLNLGPKIDNADKNLVQAEKNVRKVQNVFEKLMDLAERKCAEMWRIVFYQSPDTVKKRLFGDVITFDKDLIDDVLSEKMYKVFDEIEYDGVVEHSAKSFAKSLKALLIQMTQKR